MIVGAGLLVLAGLGLFVAGVYTGVITLYWICVCLCAVAAVLLITGRPAGRRVGAARHSTKRPAVTTATDPPTDPPTDDARPSHAAPSHSVPSDTAPADPAPESAAWDEPAATHEPATTDEHLTRAHPTAHPTSQDGAPATDPGALGAIRRRGAHAAADTPTGGGSTHMAEPGVEEVEVTDLLLVVDLTDEVLVVDEHPRYHLRGCRYLDGRDTIPLPLNEARTDGFTPCALCTPDRHLADRQRARRAGRQV